MVKIQPHRKYFKHIFYYFNIGAITPINLIENESRKDKELILFIYQLLCIMVFNFIDFKCFLNAYLEPGHHEIEFNVINVIYLMGLILLYTNFTFSKLLTSFTRNQHKEFFKGLFEVDRKIFEAFKVEVDFDKIQQEFWRMNVYCFIYFWIICLPVYLIYFGRGIPSRNIFWLLIMLKEIHTVVVVFFMVFVARNLLGRFCLTNQLLDQIGKNNKKFLTLFEIHQELVHSIKKINKQFGLLFLISISTDFSTISIRSYVPIYQITNMASLNLSVIIFTSIILMFPMIVKLILLIESMGQITEEAQRFQYIFMKNHQVLAKEDFKKSEYYIYFIHQKYDINAMGLYKINHKLIFKVNRHFYP